VSDPDLDLLSRGHYARKQIFSRSRLVAWSHGSRFDLARRLVAPRAGQRLLDYGCGDGTFLGLVVLTTALWRAGVVPAWVPAAVGVAVVGDAVASTVTAVVVTVWVLLTCALVAVARARAGSATAPKPVRSEAAPARA